MKKIIVAVLLVSLLLVAMPAVAAETEEVQTEGYARMMGNRKAPGWFGRACGPKGEDFKPDPERAKERIEQAVEAGKLTQEEADEMLAKLEAGDFPLREFDPEKIAERIEQAVEAGKLTREEADEMLAKLEAGDFPLREFDPEKIAERIEQAVEDGKLTQEQADKMLERLEEGRPVRCPGRKGHGPKRLHPDGEPDAQ